jgi:hypothetical protein
VLNASNKQKEKNSLAGDDTLQRFPIRKSELDRLKFGKRNITKLPI